MTYDELIEAKANKAPVMAFSYLPCVMGMWCEFAFVKEVFKNEKTCYAVLMDKNLNSVARFDSKDIKLKGE